MIYLHIPFCRQKCSYCNFHFSTSLNLKEEMLRAMCKEIRLRHHELQERTITSLYLGGGTPSLLSGDDVRMLMDEVGRFFDFDRNIEITLEANPDDLDEKFLKEISSAGINRLSVGVQSFSDADLKLMNRAHTATEAENSVKRAQDKGIENISIDLIYGSPISDFSFWKESLQKTIELQVPHVSSYALTVEPKTALEAWIRKNRIAAPQENTQNREFYYMSGFLKQQGFEHYEISNFGKPGFHSRHNSAYWQYMPYLGIGPSAHSYNGSNIRSWNIASNPKYIRSLEEDQLPSEQEFLTEKDRYNEMLMIGLRTTKGADLERMKQQFSATMMERLYHDIRHEMEQGRLVIENGFLKIPGQHWFFADGIAAGLFVL